MVEKKHFQYLESVCVELSTTIGETMEIIDRFGTGIALVVDGNWRLVATVTDGDIRRALLHHRGLDEPLSRHLDLDRKTQQIPVTAPEGTSVDLLLAEMAESGIHQIPIIDKDGRVVDLALDWMLSRDRHMSLHAMIMAGGIGSRLMPLTKDCPKPMLPVNGRPLLELTLDRLKECGVRNVSVSTHYLPGKIVEHFGDGSRHGVNLHYVHEDVPLGTGGALSLLPEVDETVLVINGDILTDLNFREMRQFHHEHCAVVTIGAVSHEVTIPYGVVDHEGIDVQRVVEKPVVRHLVNGGIYLVEPRARQFIPRGSRFNMTDLIEKLIAEGEKVIAFPIHEYWIDVGLPADYQRVQLDAQGGRIRTLREPVK